MLAFDAAASVLYLRGGDRLTGAGGTVSLAVAQGEEFHAFASLDSGGGSVELVSVRPVGVSDGLEVDVRLVLLGDGSFLGAWRGPLESAYEFPELRGTVITQGRDLAGYALDLRAVASRTGTYRVEAVDVTYRAGFLRTRTARIPARSLVCVTEATAGPGRCPFP